MEATRLALAFALAILATPLAAEAQLAGKLQSKDFPGGVVFVERIDEMADEKLCSVHTPMRGAEAVISGTSVAFFVHERRVPRCPRPGAYVAARPKPAIQTTGDRSPLSDPPSKG